jgi:hypothetical protein
MRRNRKWVAGWIVAACLGLPVAASAGPVVNIMQPCDCPCTHYSAMHVLTPVFYRWAAFCHGPCRYTFARNKHPDIPPTDYFKPYHCPSVNPLQFSVRNYVGLGSTNYPGLGGPVPCSCHKSQQEQQPTQAKEKTSSPPQLLPPPREESKKK